MSHRDKEFIYTSIRRNISQKRITEVINPQNTLKTTLKVKNSQTVIQTDILM